jgi:predicted dehydrogenase
MAEVFATTIDGNSNGTIVAVGSRSIDRAREFASKHLGGVKVYGCYDELVKDDAVELVYIATPLFEHYNNIKLCLEAGKNVLCEKPIVSSAKQLVELKKIADEQGCFLMEGMWTKCLPTYQKAIEWVESGRIGKIELIRVDFYKRARIDVTRSIYNKDEGGGALKDFGVYAVAFPIGFMNGKISTKSFSRKSAYKIDSDWMIHLQDDSNVQAFINISSNFGGASKAAIIGSKGCIEWDAQFNRTNTIKLYDESGKLQDLFSTKYKYDGFEYEADEAQRCIRSHRMESERSPLWQSIETLKIIDKIIQEED